MPAIPAPWKWGQEDEFKVVLSYIMSLKPSWAT